LSGAQIRQWQIQVDETMVLDYLDVTRSSGRVPEYAGEYAHQNRSSAVRLSVDYEEV
jgi:hypothetical protein